MQHADAALTDTLLHRRRAPGEPEDEPAPRSLDDVTFQEELDDLQDPLRDETFFKSVAHVWVVAFVTLAAVIGPLFLVLWKLSPLLERLNQAFTAAGVPTGAP